MDRFFFFTDRFFTGRICDTFRPVAVKTALHQPAQEYLSMSKPLVEHQLNEGVYP
jgi:hypothetical protein